MPKLEPANYPLRGQECAMIADRTHAGPSKLWVAAFTNFKTWHVFGHKTFKITSRKARQIVASQIAQKSLQCEGEGGQDGQKINHFEQISKSLLEV